MFYNYLYCSKSRPIYIFIGKWADILYKTDGVESNRQTRSLHKYWPKSDVNVELFIANLCTTIIPMYSQHTVLHSFTNLINILS